MSAAIISVLCSSAFAQRLSDTQIAKELANPLTRERSVAAIMQSRRPNIATLLSWATTPPVALDQHELRVGLADAFAALGAKQAIPFLISNITLQRSVPDPDTWMKTEQVIKSRLPAVNALIQIGPAAATAVIQAYKGLTDPTGRLAAIFVVSHTNDASVAQREFLISVVGQANLERHFAEEGLSDRK